MVDADHNRQYGRPNRPDRGGRTASVATSGLARLTDPSAKPFPVEVATAGRVVALSLLNETDPFSIWALCRGT
jgi:hypothetical protein